MEYYSNNHTKHTCTFTNISFLCFRMGRFLYQTIQHYAILVLWYRQRLQLCQPKRQILLALHQCSNAHDASW